MGDEWQKQIFSLHKYAATSFIRTLSRNPGPGGACYVATRESVYGIQVLLIQVPEHKSGPLHVSTIVQHFLLSYHHVLTDPVLSPSKHPHPVKSDKSGLGHYG
jgi:hypothetical protein